MFLNKRKEVDIDINYGEVGTFIELLEIAKIPKKPKRGKRDRLAKWLRT